MGQAQSLSNTLPRRVSPRLEMALGLMRRPLGLAGFIILLGIGAISLAAPWLPLRDYAEIHTENRFAGPSLANPFGTDWLGRDILSRIAWGTRPSLYIGFMAVILGTTVGAFIGLFSGFRGGWFDSIAQRLLDSVMAFPLLVLALIIAFALKPSINNIVIAVSIVLIPTANRVVRSAALGVRNALYVDAARATGCGEWRILIRHVLPQCMAPYLIVATAQLGAAILTEASLSFIGVGIPEPAPAWGSMLSLGAREYFSQSPWLVVFAGGALSITVFAFNLLGDALRDVLDPRLRT